MRSRERLLIQLRLLLIRNPLKRGMYLQRKKVFKSFGDNVWYQPLKIPTQPKLVKIGNGVKIATEVLFLEHDIIHMIFNETEATEKYKEYLGTIEIGDNTFIGARSIIMKNVKIGSNCIIGAGSVVTSDIPDGKIAVGVPAKVIGTVDSLKKKYELYSKKMKKLDLHDDNTIESMFW